MADTSRKRSRKSKLVPRECTIGEENDIELQVPAIKVYKNMSQRSNNGLLPAEPATSKSETYNTSVLKRILNAPLKEQVEPTSPVKFEIKVEVESCSDDETAKVDDEFAAVNDEIARIDEEFSRIDDDRFFADTKPVVYKRTTKTTKKTTMLNLLAIELTEAEVLDAADKILANTTNVADKIVDISVRNNIGHEIKGNCFLGRHETALQKTLEAWKRWQFRSHNRGDPIFYKCYVCCKSWWFLSDFRDHVRQHKELNFALEFYSNHETNVIAFEKTAARPNVTDIYTKGYCYRCNQDYNAHSFTASLEGKYFVKKECNKYFVTCNNLKSHERTCPTCLSEKKLECTLCKGIFRTEIELKRHMDLSHSVRSDIPIVSRYKNCKECSGRYNAGYLHVCAKRGARMECSYCFKSFTHRILLEIHMYSSSKSYTCEMCSVTLTRDCQKYEHMLKHTENYMKVEKCTKCEDFKVFTSLAGTYKHKILVHRSCYFEQILVPKSCILKKLDEMKSRNVLETPLAVYEAKLAEQKSKPDIPESDPDIPESDPEIPDSDPGIPDFDPEIPQSDPETNIVIKKELPDEDLEFSIKEEPIEIEENPITYTESTNENLGQVEIKQELLEQEEFEDDIIKLDIDLHGNITIKRETKEQEPTQDNLQESLPNPIIVKRETIIEPEVTIQNKQKKYYSCQCGFIAVHKVYKQHKEEECEKHKTGKLYICTKCDREFSAMKTYLAHFTFHGYNKLSCPECLEQFCGFSLLNNHVQMHIKKCFVRVKAITEDGKALEPRYQCNKCIQVVNADEFFDHWELHIEDRPKTSVKYIPRVTESGIPDDVLKETIRRLNSLSRDCNQCHRSFKRVNESKRHMIEHLLSDAYSLKHLYQDLRCQICNSGFPTAEKYKEHMRDHASLPVYKCELCNRTFSDSSNFTKHKKVHNLKVFICDLCGKKFQLKSTLEKHIERHETTTPITCEKCYKVFYFESSFRKHVANIHEKSNIGFRCVICNERFVSLKLKWNHMWEVHKERKHKADCPICLKSFRKYSDVRNHAKLEHHTDVSIYSVKNSTRIIDIERFLKTSTALRTGGTETLVIYEDDS